MAIRALRTLEGKGKLRLGSTDEAIQTSQDGKGIPPQLIRDVSQLEIQGLVAKGTWGLLARMQTNEGWALAMSKGSAKRQGPPTPHPTAPQQAGAQEVGAAAPLLAGELSGGV